MFSISQALCYVLSFSLILGGVTQSAENVLHQFQRQELTNTYYSEGIAVGDINGDQVNDVVYGPHWYAGPTFDESYEIYPAKPQPMAGYADHFFAWVHDFDRDGANDVFVVGFPGTPAYVYQNPGKGTGDWSKHQVIDWVSNESPQLLDLLGDDTPELVCTRDGFFGFATIDPSQPLASWTFHPISEKTAAAKFGHGLGIGDVNGDGRQDILHAGGWFEQPVEGANDGRWMHHDVQFSSAYGGAEMFAYDVDGDGDSDVITSEAAHDFGLSWYEQSRDATGTIEFKRHVIMGQHPSENKYGVLFSELHSVRLADMDGDGLQDIVTGKTYYSHHKQSPMWDAGAVVYWFKLVRTAEGVDWLPYEINGEAGIGRQVCVSDINGDGLLDVATGGMLGANVLTHAVTSVSDEVYQQAQPKVYSGPVPRVVPTAKRMRGSRNPVGAKGVVEGAIEGEQLNAKVSGGTAKPQPMGNFKSDRWSGDSQLWWTGAKPGDKLSLELDAFQDIESIQAVFTCAPDYGFVQLYLDDQTLGEPIDLYESAVVTTGVLEFKTPKLTRGKHILTLEIVGANANAVKSYMVGLDCLRFRSPGQIFPEAEGGIRPTAADGRILNLDFETGDLTDWTVEGDAFAGQPVEGDTVSQRRNDSSSQHEGRFWIGGFEKQGDAPKGTLTSEPFRVTARFASFLIGGGPVDRARVELLAVGEEKPFYTVGAKSSENLEQIVVDLRRVEGSQMFIRLVDDSSGGWGHLNFDHFRLHEQRPGPLTPASVPLVSDEYPHSGLEAEEAAAAMQVPDGFQVTVCAAEPDVRQPIAMTMDDKGRTWIAEAFEYPQRAEGDKGRDRILIFEDTNGDGKFDSRKVFFEGLNLVSGLEVGFGGVWVGAAPYLLFIPDANGDDQPDSEPQILLDGWGYQDTHETLNAFSWGPDGWLYGCHGVFTHSNVGKPGTPDSERTKINAGIWRYHPLKHEFDVFAHGTSNPWGVDFNEHGEAFATACVIPHLYHIINEARYRRQAGEHFNPHTYADIPTIADHFHYLGATPHSGNGKSDAAGGGHAHAGAMIYQGGAWPNKYDGALLMNNIHGQRLNMDLLQPQGSGYVGTHGPDFLLTGDQASQILNMRYGPDGQVIMIDWYDMQACHRREVEVHDRSNGRIYKVSYGKVAPVQVDLSRASDLELAQHCLNANDWYVRHSRRLLQERAAGGEVEPAAVKRLTEIALSHGEDTRRLRAMWALHSISQIDDSLFNRLVLDPSEHVRGWAIRLLAERKNNQIPVEQLAQLVALAKDDPSPVVRRSLCSITSRLPLESRWSMLEGLVRHAEDRDDHNLPLMYWYAMEPLADADADRALAMGMAAGENIPVLREFMLRRVAGSGGKEAIDRLVGGLQKSQDAELQLTFLNAIRAAFEGQRQAPKPGQWDVVYAKLSTSTNAAVRLQATALGVTFGDELALKQLRSTLGKDSVAEGDQLAAMQALLAANDPGLPTALLELIQQEGSDALREAAIRGLAQYNAVETGPVLVANYDGFSASQRRAVIATLCSRPASAKALLVAIAEKKIPSSDLTADLARQIEYLEDSELTEQLRKVWGQVRKSSAEKAELIEQYKKLVARKDLPAADLSMGRAVFAKTCQRCHVLFGEGQLLGPDLTGSNLANLDYLLENVVDPSSVMANEYRQSIILTDSGQVITGIVRGENEKAVTVQTAEATVVVPKDEIEQRRASEQSMMPDNQLSQFNEHEIRSLIAYLRAKRQVPLLATAENATSIFNGKDLAGWHGNEELWSVQDGEIIGKTAGLKENEFLVSDLLARDFKLKLEILLVGNAGNSGIQFRSQTTDNGSVKGYQADVGAGWWGKLYEEHGRGLLWDQSGEQHVKLGEWNSYEIEAVGSKIQTRINGKLCVSLDDPEGSREGIFAIQLHSGGATEVRVRNLSLEIP